MKPCCNNCADGKDCTSWRARLHRAACLLFSRAKELGYEHVVYEDAPLVRMLDFLFQSECKYCMATRALVFGVGVGIGGWLGGSLIAVAVGLTFFERFCKGE